MNTDKGSPIRVAAYLENLLIQLRLRDVPGDRIGQILAEVETHVADTGQDPVDAFGEPGEYAEQYVAVSCSAPARSWLRDLGVAALGAFAGLAVGNGAIHLVGSAHVTARDLGVWLATVGVGLIVVNRVLWPLMARESAGSLKPRTVTSRSVVLGSVALGAVIAVLVLIGLLPTGPVLVSVPGWVLLGAGLLTVLGLVRLLGGDRVVDPRG